MCHNQEILEKAIEMNRAVIIAPIVGQDTKIEDFPLMGSFLKEIVTEENVDLSILKNSIFCPADYKGSYRAIKVKPIEIKFMLLVIEL